MTMTLTGGCGIPGCADGVAVIKQDRPAVDYNRPAQAPQQEIERFRQAALAYLRELDACYEESLERLGEDSAKIFKAYKEILQDEVFFEEAFDLVRQEGLCMEAAVRQKMEDAVALFSDTGDDYLTERAADVENVCSELIARMAGVQARFHISREMGESLVVFAHDLTPVDTIQLDKSLLAGFVTEKGGLSSHTAILARTLGIPAVVGLAGAVAHARAGDRVLLYGDAGEVVIRPGGEELAGFTAYRESTARRQALDRQAAAQKAVTRDGRTIHICQNCGDFDSADSFDPAICDGVGLFRTEFLYMHYDHAPTEEEQLAVYGDMARKTGGRELIFRTLDIGGDKRLDYLDLPREDNPFLGVRAIRLSLRHPNMLKTQVRAILRAGLLGNVKMMFPMIATVEELLEAKEIVAWARRELAAQNIPHRPNVPVGIMVETPAAAMMSDNLARHADFFSIGVNDLAQYMTAADRMNENLAHLGDFCNPAVLRAIRLVARNARAAGIPVGICGEAAAEPLLAPVWIAMDIDELSMAPSGIGRIKRIIRMSSRTEALPVMEQALCCDTIAQTRSLLDAYVQTLSP